ncbi:hypothetical protein [Halorientalis litorea]|uniref:hypothetical protein n=1 Tax=Halorientalis litorea TaxID=2931977 RepID=UPI001FF4E683|nr:hypothetical protein [Halorientalis litorea]
MSESTRTHPVPSEHVETARVRKQDTSHPSALTTDDIDALLATVEAEAVGIRETLRERAARTERVETATGDAVAYLGPDTFDAVFDAMGLGDCVQKSMARVAHTEAADAAGLDAPDQVVLVGTPD